MDRDFLYFFHIDLAEALEGRTRFTPRRLLSLSDQFPEGSEYDAARLGNRQLRDWGVDVQVLVGILDALNLNTLVSGNWKEGKRPEFPPTERPKSKYQQEAEDAAGPSTSGRSLKDLFGAFAAGDSTLPAVNRTT